VANAPLKYRTVARFIEARCALDIPRLTRPAANHNGVAHHIARADGRAIQGVRLDVFQPKEHAAQRGFLIRGYRVHLRYAERRFDVNHQLAALRDRKR
jgi:hypothetical protein